MHAVKGMLLEAAPGGTIMAGLANAASVTDEVVSLPPQATKKAAAAMGKILKTVFALRMEIPRFMGCGVTTQHKSMRLVFDVI